MRSPALAVEAGPSPACGRAIARRMLCADLLAWRARVHTCFDLTWLVAAQVVQAAWMFNTDDATIGTYSAVLNGGYVMVLANYKDTADFFAVRARASAGLL